MKLVKKLMSLVVLAAAATVLTGISPPDDRTVKVIKGREIWEGTRIVRRVVVEKGGILEVKPGTRIRFAYYDEDKDGVGDAGIEVRGRIIVAGSADKRVVFEGDRENCGRAWKEIEVVGAEGASFENADFICAHWAIHLHDTAAVIRGCSFTDGYGGVRFKGGQVRIEKSNFEKNSLGVRFLDSSPRIEKNAFRENGTAIYVREGSTGAVISGNNFSGSAEYSVAIGESQAAEVRAEGNWWGTVDEKRIRKGIFERAGKGYTGIVKYLPFLQKENPDAGH